MYHFNKKFVHFMWDDELEGKKVIYADDIPSLIECVDAFETCELEVVSYSENDEYPFLVNDNKWMFIYYDPHYGLKVAREQGKVIQRYWKSEQEWEEYIGDDFPDDISFYRIKPEVKPVTNRELAKWLAMGNGEYQMRKGDQFSCFNEYSYDAQDANEPTEIPCVRKWEEEEWHEITREYMGLED